VSYKKAMEILGELTPKKLYRGIYDNAGCLCAVGALLSPDARRRIPHNYDTGADPLIAELWRQDPRIRQELEELELTLREVQEIQHFNDGFEGLPETRYLYILERLREFLNKEEACEL
jgi:hypothetical protein